MLPTHQGLCRAFAQLDRAVYHHVKCTRTLTARACTPGSSGSGKTTFLNSVHDLHKCTYVRQYHTLRPYIPVSKIPDFDPTQLPYWNLYSQVQAHIPNPNPLKP